MTVTAEQGATAPFSSGYKRPKSAGFTSFLHLQDLLFGPSTPGVFQLFLPKTELVFLGVVKDSKDKMGRPAYSTNVVQLTLADYEHLSNYPETCITHLIQLQQEGFTSDSLPSWTVPEQSPPTFTQMDRELLNNTFTKQQRLDLLSILLANSQKLNITATVKLPKNIDPTQIIYAFLKLVPAPLRTFSWSTCRNGAFNLEQPHVITCFKDSRLIIRIENMGKTVPQPLQFLASHLLADPESTQKTFAGLYEELLPRLAAYYVPIEYMASATEDKSLMRWLLRQYLDAKLYSRVAKYAMLLESLK